MMTREPFSGSVWNIPIRPFTHVHGTASALDDLEKNAIRSTTVIPVSRLRQTMAQELNVVALSGRSQSKLRATLELASQVPCSSREGTGTGVVQSSQRQMPLESQKRSSPLVDYFPGPVVGRIRLIQH
jgi:hypothetical protein